MNTLRNACAVALISTLFGGVLLTGCHNNPLDSCRTNAPSDSATLADDDIALVWPSVILKGESATDGREWPLDIDDDGIPDFSIRVNSIATTDVPSSAGSHEFVLDPVSDDAELLVDPTSHYCGALAHGAMIGPDTSPLIWTPYSVTLCVMSWSGEEGRTPWQTCFAQQTVEYVGIRLRKEESWYYGWLAFNIDLTETFTINYVADKVESVADEPVVAGEG